MAAGLSKEGKHGRWSQPCCRKGLAHGRGPVPCVSRKSVVENVNGGRRLWGGLPLGTDWSVKNIAGMVWPGGRCACACAVHVLAVVGRSALLVSIGA